MWEFNDGQRHMHKAINKMIRFNYIETNNNKSNSLHLNAVDNEIERNCKLVE